MPLSDACWKAKPKSCGAANSTHQFLDAVDRADNAQSEEGVGVDEGQTPGEEDQRQQSFFPLLKGEA